jgi:hypothetical protein
LHTMASARSRSSRPSRMRSGSRSLPASIPRYRTSARRFRRPDKGFGDLELDKLRRVRARGQRDRHRRITYSVRGARAIRPRLRRSRREWDDLTEQLIGRRDRSVHARHLLLELEGQRVPRDTEGVVTRSA